MAIVWADPDRLRNHGPGQQARPRTRCGRPGGPSTTSRRTPVRPTCWRHDGSPASSCRQSTGTTATTTIRPTPTSRRRRSPSRSPWPPRPHRRQCAPAPTAAPLREPMPDHARLRQASGREDADRESTASRLAAMVAGIVRHRVLPLRWLEGGHAGCATRAQVLPVIADEPSANARRTMSTVSVSTPGTEAGTPVTCGGVPRITWSIPKATRVRAPTTKA